MTTAEKLKKMMIESSLGQLTVENIEEVFSEVKAKIESMNPSYQITWDRDAEEYLGVLFNLWRSIALDATAAYLMRKNPNILGELLKKADVK